MRRQRHTIFGLAAVPVLTLGGMLTLGCGGAGAGSAAPTSVQASLSNADALKAMYRGWSDYHDVHNTGPANLDELQAASQGKTDVVEAIEHLQGAGYSLVYTKSLREATDGTSKTVLASGPQPTLYLDGTVQ